MIKDERLYFKLLEILLYLLIFFPIIAIISSLLFNEYYRLSVNPYGGYGLSLFNIIILWIVAVISIPIIVIIAYSLFKRRYRWLVAASISLLLCIAYIFPPRNLTLANYWAKSFFINCSDEASSNISSEYPCYAYANYPVMNYIIRDQSHKIDQPLSEWPATLRDRIESGKIYSSAATCQRRDVKLLRDDLFYFSVRCE